MRSVALFRVGRDYGVTMLDLKISGLREVEKGRLKHSDELSAIQEELVGIMPKLKDMYTLDLVMEDSLERRYIVRLYTYGGIVYYALLVSPHSTMKRVVKRLTQQKWKPMIFIERLAVKASTAHGADSESASQ